MSKTPLEVAQHKKRQNIFQIVNDHIGLAVGLRLLIDEEVMDGKQRSKCKRAISKVTEKNESEVRLMMRRGEVPANMWSVVWSSCIETQKNIPRLQQEQTDTNAELAKVNEQIMQLQQKKIDLEQRLRGVQQNLSNTMISPPVLHALKTLASAEQNEQEQLKVQLKKKKESTLLSIEELGYFLNAAGISSSTQKLISLAAQDHETEMSLSDMCLYISESVSLGDRLEVQFAIDMVRHNQYPPYDEHRKECPVCRNSVIELLAEYQISLKENDVAKISSSGLMYLERSDITQLLVTNTNIELLRCIRAINSIRQNHFNFITDGQ